MKKNLFIIIIFAAILAVVVWVQFLNKTERNQNLQTPTLSESVVSVLNLETQTNSEGAVTISVAPHKSASTGAWEFEITLDTHSLELSEDLTKTAVLIANNESYEPIAWDGDSPGGHHRNGILQFAPISLQLESIALKIRNVGGVEERNFTWQLK